MLKEMFDLTDEETPGRVDYDLRWHVALDLKPEDARVCRKTLHNFRAKLLGDEAAKRLFAEMTDGMIRAPGLSAARQRLDSTHIVSNMAYPTRLRLFCETIRVFLRELKKGLPKRWESVPERLRGRYLKCDGSDSSYHDANREETRRRLSVCGRDVYRLLERFRGETEVEALKSYGLLKRLFAEQCEVADEAEGPSDGDADAGEGSAPVKVKASSEVPSWSLQSPHDPDATYSGLKGKGYEAQVVETVGNGEKPEMITAVKVTPSREFDDRAVVPIVEELGGRGMAPEELVADAAYGSTDVALECKRREVELMAPVRGPGVRVEAAGKSEEEGKEREWEQEKKGEQAQEQERAQEQKRHGEQEKEKEELEGEQQEEEKSLADFEVDVRDASRPVRCPRGREAESQEVSEEGKVVARYSRACLLYTSPSPRDS